MATRVTIVGIYIYIANWRRRDTGVPASLLPLSPFQSPPLSDATLRFLRRDPSLPPETYILTLVRGSGSGASRFLPYRSTVFHIIYNFRSAQVPPAIIRSASDGRSSVSPNWWEPVEHAVTCRKLVITLSDALAPGSDVTTCAGWREWMGI